MTTKTTKKFLPEVRERAVRMVLEHVGEYPTRWAGVESIAAKTGWAAQTLHDWTRKAEVDGGKRAGMPSEVAEKLKALERENRELRQVNEILRKASAYFVQAELDRPFKR
jgi:transposase